MAHLCLGFPAATRVFLLLSRSLSLRNSDHHLCNTYVSIHSFSLLKNQKHSCTNDGHFPDLSFQVEGSIGGGSLLEIREKKESSSMASKVYDPIGVVGEVKPKNVVIQNQKALGDIGNLVNIPTGKDIARKAEVVVITILEEDEKSCRPHAASGGLKDAVIDDSLHFSLSLFLRPDNLE
ncbi:hypothetical protein F2Q68_00025881 [Brassica cretica]|uniref:Uncharacterized protein n=2 Tax=Brassica cretica TaxID=69181 RepID=A0A8S9IDD9_BRACR|nr:hypothetical protein F2Q68_00025881 [Brassica cretica]KAF3577067.1 hypothetical protein DY000_02031856 [Brassica cretica]